MSAEVTQLPRAHRVGFAPDPAVVKHLEDALDLAKSGKIRAVATVVVYHDDLIADGSTGSGWALTEGTRFALSYGIQGLLTRFAQYCHIDRRT